MLLKLPCYKNVTNLIPLRKSALSKCCHCANASSKCSKCVSSVLKFSQHMCHAVMVSVSVLLCCACSAGWLNDNTHRHARMNSEKRISRQFSSFVCHCYYRDIWEVIGTFLKLGKLLALKKGLTAPTPNQLHMFYVVVLKSVFFLTFCVFGALQSAWQNQKQNTNSTRKSDAWQNQKQNTNSTRKSDAWQNQKQNTNSTRKSDARKVQQPHHNELHVFLFFLLETKTPRTLLLQKRWRPATTYLSGRTRSSTYCTRPWTAPTASCRQLPTSAWRRWGSWRRCVQVVCKAWSFVCKIWTQWWYWVPNCLACIII